MCEPSLSLSLALPASLLGAVCPLTCFADGTTTGETRTVDGIDFPLPPPDLNDPRSQALIENNVLTDDPFYDQPVDTTAPASMSTATAEGSACTADQLLVKFKPTVFTQTILDLLNGYGATHLTYMHLTGWRLISVPAWLNVKTFKAFLDREPIVEQTSYNWIHKAGSTPTDQYYNMPYNFTLFSGTIQAPVQWALHNINMEAAWSRTLGDPRITIAVCDTGIATAHPDLNPKIARDAYGNLRGYSVVNGAPSYEDTNFHGTFVSGIAAAQTTFTGAAGSGVGIAGVCPLSPLLPIKISTGSSASSTTTYEAAAITYALSQPDVKVINMSFAGSNPDSSLQTAVATAYRRGVLFVSITGNLFDGSSGPNVYPGAYQGAMAVGATDIRNNSASYSNAGPQISASAPGGDTVGLSHSKTSGIGDAQCASTTLASRSYYEFAYGTSFAAPHVSGVAALLFAEFPSMMGWDVKGRIEDTAFDANAAAKPGYDTDLGWGLINADAATQQQSRFTNGYAPVSQRMVSLPVWPSNLDVADKSSDPARLYPNSGATVLAWDAATGKYQQYASYMVARMGPGRGYFASFPRQSPQTTYTGAYPFQNPGHPVTVHLQQGWNLIGCPGINQTSWNKQNIRVNYNGSVVSLAQATANQWTNDFAWHLNVSTQQYEMVNTTPSALHSLVPGEGYWFLAIKECDLLLPGS